MWNEDHCIHNEANWSAEYEETRSTAIYLGRGNAFSAADVATITHIVMWHTNFSYPVQRQHPPLC